MTNNLQQTLTDRLKAKMIEDRKASEQIFETELRMFKQNIQKQFNDANASIDSNMAKLNRKLHLYQLKPWIVLLVVSLSLIPCLVIGTYWTNNHLDITIRHKLTTLEKHNRALKALGDVKIEHRVLEDGLYLITPNNKEPSVYPAEHFPGQWIIKIED